MNWSQHSLNLRQPNLKQLNPNQLKNLRGLFESRRWYDLVPDVGHRTVTDGLGEFHGMDYLAAARTTDGSTVIAYVPSRRMFSVDLTQLRASKANVWWFDPRSGGAELASVEPTGRRLELDPPSCGDWVLVLDDADLRRSPPGAWRRSLA